ncbi:MAG: hypothetical protein ACE5EI_06655 [Thermodesulfobacteriota bacterium]
MDSILCLLGDSVILVALHVGLLILLVYAVRDERKRKRDTGSKLSVVRGEKSWNYLYLAYGISSVVVIQIISVSESGKGYKVFITVLDMGVLFYLTFFNGWFRNKTIGFITKSQTKEE